jgi:hypothetical protein
VQTKHPLEASRGVLCQLASQFLRVQESERRRIARGRQSISML